MGHHVNGLPEDPKERRRAINRRSQAKTRKHRDDLLQQLQAENEKLRLQLEAAKRAEAAATAALGTAPTLASPSIYNRAGSVSNGASSSGSTEFRGHIARNSESPSAFPLYTNRLNSKRKGVDVDVCKEAFVAALVAVCAPHLNTIHHVCELFVKARHAEPPPYYGSTPSSDHSGNSRAAGSSLPIYSGYSSGMVVSDLTPTTAASGGSRSPNEGGATTGAQHYTPHAGVHQHLATPLGTTKPLPHLPISSEQPTLPSNNYSSPFAFDSFNFQFGDLDAAAYIPPLGSAGPLSVPFLEPHHPLGGEVDVEGIWTRVLLQVDLKATDLEHLAVKMCPRVRCYGQGPTMLMADVDTICGEFPALTLF